MEEQEHKVLDVGPAIEHLKSKGYTDVEEFSFIRTAMQMTSFNADLIEERDEAHKAMQEFVDRCELGEVRSKYTYMKFKKILESK